MWYNKNNSQVIVDSIGITINNIQYPSDIFRVWNNAELNAIGIYRVVEVAPPIVSNLQIVTEGIIALVAGVPTQTWVVSDRFTDTPSYANSLTGVVVPAKTKLQHETEYLAAEQVKTTLGVIKHFTDFTDAYIQTAIDNYNIANNTAFAKIENFSKYLISTDTRYAIATRFLTWNGKIWDAVTTLRNNAVTTGIIPTDISFKATLDAVIF